MYNRLDKIVACDEHMDRQMDGRTSCHSKVLAVHTRRMVKNQGKTTILYNVRKPNTSQCCCMCGDTLYFSAKTIISTCILANTGLGIVSYPILYSHIFQYYTLHIPVQRSFTHFPALHFKHSCISVIPQLGGLKIAKWFGLSLSVIDHKISHRNKILQVAHVFEDKLFMSSMVLILAPFGTVLYRKQIYGGHQTRNNHTRLWDEAEEKFKGLYQCFQGCIKACGHTVVFNQWQPNQNYCYFRMQVSRLLSSLSLNCAANLHITLELLAFLTLLALQ